MGKSGLV